MRRKIWLAVGGAGLAIALVFLLMPLFSPAGRQPPQNPAPQNRSFSVAKETHYKRQSVRRDALATEQLNRMQTARDARVFFHASGTEQKEQKTKLAAFVRQHPELVTAAWLPGPGQRPQTAGTPSAGLRSAASAYWSRGQGAVRRGTPYSSPMFTYDGRSYYVHAEPAKTAGKGMVMLVSSSLVQEVERQQRLNMRLVPFPAEGRYRIESAVPNTTKDVEVRTGEDNGHVSHYSVDEVVVKFHQPLTPAQLLRLRTDLDLVVVRHTRQTYVFRSKKHHTDHMMAYFKKMNPVYVEPHYLYLTNEQDGETDPQVIVPNDTLYSKYQWNLPEIETERGWNWGKGNDKVVVAVVDTGVQSDHPDLKGRLVPGVNIVDPSKPPEDDVGHGTHVAGIIAAQVNNNEGVAGLTWYTKIMPVKALDSSGSGSTYSVAEGIIWAVDHGADVINMSLGNYAQAQFLHDAVRYAHDHGVVLVAASGNDNTDRPGYPAAYPEVLAVAATDPGSVKAEYSNYGDYIDVAAPGTQIASTYPGSRYAALSGTSMACPHVSALASLVRSANPELSNDEVMDLLRRTANDVGDKGKDNVFGYGEIDVRNALRAAGGQAASLQLYPRQIKRELRRVLGF
ncbi:peptidase S8 [Cohnella pontilimi]|uniref:Peptidase S8 n=1 Tax=Cohnella pontilimi TaxID=2564100 RepID=A0A4U0FEN2_9BACL|nr:S8 family peptidase [Cohnella pontilimi]TJY43406.1 peptidase S8 [Cohnella pontilimi]